jgi:hypothetical protein
VAEVTADEPAQRAGHQRAEDAAGLGQVAVDQVGRALDELPDR